MPVVSMRNSKYLEEATVVLFGALVVLGFGMLFVWYQNTTLLKSLVHSIDNGDAVCDDFEVLTARPVEDTPCGSYLRLLVVHDQSI